jgi:hypothetical protein
LATSFLNPLISIPIAELEKMLDSFVPVELFNDTVASGTFVRATKEGVIKLAMEYNRILYRVPVRLQVKKDIGISVAKTNCKILMQFKTVFVIASDWSIRTKTELQQYGWLEKPQLDLGFLSVPIVSVLEGVLNSKQQLICKTIDDQAKKLTIKDPLQTLLKSLPNPFEAPMIGPVFWECSVVDTLLHPLEVIDGDLKLTLGLKSDLNVGIGASIPNSPLEIKAPEFTKNKRAPSQLMLKTKTAIATIEQIFNEQFSGQSYDVEQFTIVPSDIKLSCDGQRMTLTSTLSGSFSGKVILHGIPFFNPKDNTLYCREVDIELEGAGLKSKSIVMLASKLIKKKVEDNLLFPIDPLVAEINKQINSYAFNGGIVKAYIINYKLANLSMAIETIDVDVDIEALVTIEKK